MNMRLATGAHILASSIHAKLENVKWFSEQLYTALDGVRVEW